ncbi:hypothetical protein [Hymenobacter latericus]|uniref:hypothetical protein n=1 Tax=Hymenobacter sp. YIM 151858-1 TaxID=2987688 RepID=UPI002227C322|nr:hypothetical protein [Hymenobacter sp. YIM 151858-1]UYZ60060.1 hypothetical protein OIS50_04490 [Hymenobacter sp. YIM 151858-1]
MPTPFTAYRHQGWRVFPLHTIGKAHVARLTKPGEAPLFAVRYRGQQATAATHQHAAQLVRQAIAEHQQKQAQIDATQVTPALLVSFGLNPQQVSRFYEFNRLDRQQAYPFGELRKIVLARKKCNCGLFRNELLTAANRIQNAY